MNRQLVMMWYEYIFNSINIENQKKEHKLIENSLESKKIIEK